MTVNELLHRLWSKAVGTPNYDKAEWLELERAMEKGVPSSTQPPTILLTSNGVDVVGAQRCAKHHTLIFEVNQGGCVHTWVSARDHVHALRMMADTGNLDGHSWTDDINVRATPFHVAAEQNVRDDDSHARTLLDLWMADTAPGIIASTEN